MRTSRGHVVILYYIMGFITTITTVSIILLFSLDIATDVATGVELVLNDNPYCEFCFGLLVRLE